MTAILPPCPEQPTPAQETAAWLDARLGKLDSRSFADGESLVAIAESSNGPDAAIVARLHDPDAIALALRFAAARSGPL